MVNPYYFYNGTEKQRFQLLRDILEEPYTELIQEMRKKTKNVK